MEIQVFDQNNRSNFITLNVPERYIQDADYLNDMIEEGLQPSFSTDIDLQLVEEYFTKILPLYYDGKNFDYELNDGLRYLQLSQRLLDSKIEKDISNNLSDYLMSDDITTLIKNDNSIGASICQYFEEVPLETELAIVSKLKINTLQYLIEKYPNKPWNWRGLSKNPSITPEFVEKHMDLPWN